MNNIMGKVFNIQRYSLHDGPGIRTIVFLQGCPLRCKWCSNPESQSTSFQMLFQEKDCIGCRECLYACTSGAISFGEDDYYPTIDRSACTDCFDCVKACPTKALHMSGRIRTVEDVMTEVLKDKAFYDKSGGGMTLSGGEAMLQPDFAIALLDAAREHGIHTAMETTGYVKPEVFLNVSQHLDLILFDFKHLNDEKHQHYTGVSNRLIRDNLKRILAYIAEMHDRYDEEIRLAQEENEMLDNPGPLVHIPEVIVRIPVIPEFNYSPDELSEMARYLRDIGATKVNLLPFHQMGENKYKMLGQKYEFADHKALYEENLIEALKIFLSLGLDTEIV